MEKNARTCRWKKRLPAVKRADPAAPNAGTNTDKDRAILPS
jgi:hypothetical protein